MQPERTMKLPNIAMGRLQKDPLFPPEERHTRSATAGLPGPHVNRLAYSRICSGIRVASMSMSVCQHAAARYTCIRKDSYLPGNIGRHGVFVPKSHRLILHRKPKENAMKWAQISSFSVNKAVYTKILILLTLKAIILQPVQRTTHLSAYAISTYRKQIPA